jgi:hypothetical protein
MAEGWTPTYQRQTTRITNGGRFEQVMEVHFRTDHGTEAYIDVPLSQYQPDRVKALVDAYVANIAAVHEL